MKEEISIKDIFFLYVSVILICWIICLKYQENQSHKEKIEIMKLALENDRLAQEYISILQESREQLNTAIDNQNLELQEYRYLEKLKKDLS